jgi:outer membrane immunogenic protein
MSRIYLKLLALNRGILMILNNGRGKDMSRILKNVLITLAAFAVTSSAAFAGDGAYLGGVIGRDVGVTSTTFPAPGGGTLENGMSGFAGGVFGGYGFDFDQFNVAAEAFANYSGSDGNTTAGGAGNVKTAIQYNYGLAVLPGFKFTDETAMYGRLGFTRGAFRASGTLLPASVNADLNGLQLGIGIETTLSDTLTARGEYVYNKYQSTTVGGVQYSPETNQFNVGVAWHFM